MFIETMERLEFITSLKINPLVCPQSQPLGQTIVCCLQRMNILFLLATAWASQTCSFCGEPSCSVTMQPAIHSSGAFALSFVFNTTQFSITNLQPWCFNVAVGSQQVITCIPDCEAHCVVGSFSPTIKPIGAPLHIPFDFHFNRDTKIVTIWSGAGAFSCDHCEAIQPHSFHAFFCPV